MKTLTRIELALGLIKIPKNSALSSVNIQPEGWVQLDGNIEEESEIKLWEASEKLLKDWWNDD